MKLKNVVVGEYVEAKHSEPLIGLTESSYYLVVAVDDSDEYSNVCINTEKFDGLWLSARDFRKANTESKELTGEALVMAMLKNGKDKVLVRVSSSVDTPLDSMIPTFAKKDGDKVVTNNGNSWEKVIAIDIDGNPLTAKDVGL